MRKVCGRECMCRGQRLTVDVFLYCCPHIFERGSLTEPMACSLAEALAASELWGAACLHTPSALNAHVSARDPNVSILRKDIDTACSGYQGSRRGKKQDETLSQDASRPRICVQLEPCIKHTLPWSPSPPNTFTDRPARGELRARHQPF